MLGRATLCFSLIAAPLSADVLQCFGEGPDWKLGLGESHADFVYQRQIRFEIPLVTKARDGRAYPRAFTLTAPGETAIVLVDRDTCQHEGVTYNASVDILTQDGSEAIILTGCCASLPE